MAGGYSDFEIVSDFDIRISDLTVLRILLFDQVRIYFDVTLRYPLKSLYNIAYCIIILF